MNQVDLEQLDFDETPNCNSRNEAKEKAFEIDIISNDENYEVQHKITSNEMKVIQENTKSSTLSSKL